MNYSYRSINSGMVVASPYLPTYPLARKMKTSTDIIGLNILETQFWHRTMHTLRYVRARYHRERCSLVIETRDGLLR